MEIATFERILIVVAFLGALALVLVFVRIAKGSGRLNSGTRQKSFRVVSSQVLGPEGRAVMLDVDGRSILVVLGRKGGTTALDLDAVAPAENAQ